MGSDLEVHHESRVFLHANRALLLRAGAHWARPAPFEAALARPDFLDACDRDAADVVRASRWTAEAARTGRAWGWKDPRNTFTLPVWLRCFPEARLVHVVRNGVDVALSLHRRERVEWFHRRFDKRMLPTIGAAYRLWSAYVRAGRVHCGAHRPSLFLRYEDLVARPAETIAALAAAAGVTPSPEQVRAAHSQIHGGSRRSALDRARVRLLVRFGRLDLRPMQELGYDPW
jgi:hypothetical protein